LAPDGEWSTSSPGCFIPEEAPQYKLKKKACGRRRGSRAHVWVFGEEKNFLPLLKFETRKCPGKTITCKGVVFVLYIQVLHF